VRPLLLGLSIGLAAGISPGPLLVLVVTSTLRSGWGAGAAAACAPLLSDAIVVGGVLVVLDRLPRQALSLLGLVGGSFVIYLGISTVREARGATLNPAAAGGEDAGRIVRKAALVNLLSPHPWLAWATALGPLTIATWRAGEAGAVALVASFYVGLIGAKVAVAALVAGGRRRLNDRGYRGFLAGAGALLALAGIGLIAEFAPAAL